MIPTLLAIVLAFSFVRSYPDDQGADCLMFQIGSHELYTCHYNETSLPYVNR